LKAQRALRLICRHSGAKAQQPKPCARSVARSVEKWWQAPQRRASGLMHGMVPRARKLG